MREPGCNDRRPVIGILLHDLSLGGTERVAIRLANAWSRLGCRVVIHVGDAGGMQRALVGSDVKVVVADPPIRRGRGSRQRLGRWFGARCADGGIEVAFFPGNFYFVALATFIAASGGKVRAFAKISNRLRRPERSVLRNLVFARICRWRLRRAAGVVALSPALLLEARQMLGKRVPLVELPNPVIDALPVPQESVRDAHRLCAVGRLVPQKNFALLLHSFALLGDLPLTLDIIGDGPGRAMLEQLASSLGVADRVRFLGEVHDVERHLGRAAMLLLTSDFEGYPGVIVEALASGTYVVARDCSPAIREMLASDRLGRVVAGDDPASFAQAVRESLGKPGHDPAMQAFAARHLVEGVARQYLELFARDAS